MASLNGQTISSSYEQLLHVDRDGGGNTTTHVSVKDGDNGTTFGFTIATDALMMTSTNRLEFGDNASYIHQSADGVLDLVSDTEIELTATTIDINGAVDMSSTLAVADDITLANNKYYQVKDTGGSAIRIAGLANDNNIFLGAIDDAGASVHIREDGSNVLSFTGGDATFAGDVNLAATKTLFLDGASGHTFITEFSANKMQLQAGGNGSIIVDGSNSGEIRLGIGTSSPDKNLEISQASDGTTLRITSRQNDSSHSTTTPFSSLEFYSEDGSGSGAGSRGAIRSYPSATSGGDGELAFDVSGSERMRISSDGDVGIGDTSPSTALTSFGSASKGLSIKNAQPTIALTDTDTGGGHLWIANGGGIGYFQNSVSGATMRFYVESIQALTIENDGVLKSTDGIEFTGSALTGSQTGIASSGSGGDLLLYSNGSAHSRLNSNGNFLFGCTSFPSASVSGFGITGTSSGNASSSGSSTSAWNHLLFYNGNGIVGSISTSGSTTTYSTSSDYRLKENQVPISDGLTRLNQLKPYRFNFIADADTTVDGFFAHEVAEIVPEAIIGEKDAVDDEGNIVSQGIDQSKLVPLLVKAVQELSAKVEALENA